MEIFGIVDTDRDIFCYHTIDIEVLGEYVWFATYGSVHDHGTSSDTEVSCYYDTTEYAYFSTSDIHIPRGTSSECDPPSYCPDITSDWPLYLDISSCHDEVSADSPIDLDVATSHDRIVSYIPLYLDISSRHDTISRHIASDRHSPSCCIEIVIDIGIDTQIIWSLDDGIGVEESGDHRDG